MSMPTVHHLENSRSQRVLWLLEELEVPYELVRYERHPETMRAPATLERIHPLGKSPVVTIGDSVVLAETGAIIEYFVEAYPQGKLRPELGSAAERRYRFWLHYAEGSLMPPLLVRLIFSRVMNAPLPFFVKPIVKRIVNEVDSTFTGPEIAKHTRFIDNELVQFPWFAGEEFSAADVQMSFALEVMMARGRSGVATGNIESFLARISARPAYQRALERGGPYDLGMG